ncbi:3-dehydroquinate synthase [Kytococcus aerolatus]|uniref:Shikimate kinase n=1 Tax=Kytococcus aerolatus TaxID=592308 RepID=A0A212T015_9MICO|nr:bifunctional shikimate kinase/3-dehydroquinate synthase [Kytococcus aerolatus]SNC59210.1 3-dehydroquinate synthase [Kytococcus aerolatus]
MSPLLPGWRRSTPAAPRADVVLVGPPGVGKTTVGRILAGEGGQQLDTDEMVERAAGRTIPEVFAAQGEEGFRRLEAEAAERALRTMDGQVLPLGVVSLGGGAVETPRVCELLAEHVTAGGDVVWLQVAPEAVAGRLAGGGRPLLAGEAGVDRWRELVARRQEAWAASATVQVDTTGRPAHEVAEIVGQRLVERHTTEDPGEPFGAGLWPVDRGTGLRIRVTTTEGSYPVELGHRVLDGLPALVAATGRPPTGVLVVHQPGLEERAARVRDLLRTGEGRTLPVALHRIEPAEAGKQLEGVAGIWEACAAAGLDRRALLVSVGGGACTDVTGFAAATWMRGIDVVHLPTTLLGMVDASVGGKTGINTAAGKNLVGAFHQPRAVVADLDLLDGLPVEDVRAGLAEVAKCGWIDAAETEGPELLELLREGPRTAEDPRAWPVLARLVEGSLRVKARAVAADTREAGVREHLNFGHTLGHALEKVEDYRMRHGDAVAIGMVYAAALGEELGLWPGTGEVREILAGLDLPTRYTGDATWPQVRAVMAGDKKARAGALRFVLLEEPGEPTAVDAPDETALERAWAAVT